MAKKKPKRSTSPTKPHSESVASGKVVSQSSVSSDNDFVTKPPTKTAAVAATPQTRIMIVDDHELMRYGLKELMAGQPDLMVCGEASDHQEALREFEKTAPDLLIVDVSLKTSNGPLDDPTPRRRPSDPAGPP